MKRMLSLFGALLVCMALSAQTLRVVTGMVNWLYKASDTGNMTYTDGQTLTIGQRTYNISDIDAIIVDDTPVEDATVVVAYDGDKAGVMVSGDVAPYIEVKGSGAHVSIVASSSLTQEITYTLVGESTNGSFTMDGELKATFMLNGLSLHNPDGAAMYIKCGKQLKMRLADGTVNSLSDGLTSADDGSDYHKAALYLNGHSTWKGTGSLTVTGNVKHGISCDEYMELGKSLGNITVSTTQGDGIHVKEYFQMAGGTLNITSQGDGVDVEVKKSSTDEQNGQIVISGGTLNVSTSGDATKGLKCDADMVVSGGTINATTTGAAVYEADEADLSSCAAAKPDGAFTMTGGEMTLSSSGAGGKGLNATGRVTVSGGTLIVCTTGSVHVYGTLDSKPQAIKSDTDIVLEGGSILSCASEDSGTAFKTDYKVLTNGATVMGIGGKQTKPDASSTHGYTTYKGVSVSGGQTISYDGVTFTVPGNYTNSSAKIMVSSAEM